MRLSSVLPVAPVLPVLLLLACSDAAESPYSFRGLSPGMSLDGLRGAAGAAGTQLECRPLVVEGLSVDRLCYSPDSLAGMVNVVGAVTPGGSVPYISVREAMTTPAAYDRLAREWGNPDTAVGSARRWRRGAWMANADTAADILTVWLSDTATEARMAVASARELRMRSGLDTLALFTDDQAVLDSLLRSGQPAPRLAADLTERPAVIRCGTVGPPPHLTGVNGMAIVAYVVDTAGNVEPGLVRVLQASHAGLADPAIATIRSCTLRPGRDAGRPVRTVIQQRVTFTPTR